MGRLLSIHSKCIDFIFFLLNFRFGRRRIFFFFFLCSQHVPFKVPNGFPSGSQCVSQWFSQKHLDLIPYVLPKVLPFSPIYRWAKGRSTSSFHRFFYSLGSLHSFNSLFWDSPTKCSCCKDKKKVGNN